MNSNEGLPVHWDISAPLKYMGIDQQKHKYKDFICPSFALYCRNTDMGEPASADRQGKERATVDVVGVGAEVH